MHKIPTLLIILCLLFIAEVRAQSVLITGKVIDKETDEGIPFATVAFKGSPRTISTDFDGYYKIEGLRVADSLVASCIDYEKLTVRVRKQTKEQVINFSLSRATYNKKQAAAMKRGETRALEIMKKVVKNKRSHDRDKLDSYAYEAYTKIEIDMDDLNEKFQNRKIFRPFKFIFNNVDTTSEMNPFLPFFITETVSDFYHKKSPFYPNREIIKAAKVSGINDLSITQFLGSTYVAVNVYDDLIKLLDRQFVSPASTFGLTAYNYFLADSQVIDHFKCYKIRFLPKTKKQPLSLEGEVWIADSVFAIKQISLGMSPGSDVNLVRSISLFNEFIPVQDSVWMLKKEKLSVHFIKSAKSPGLAARKIATYKNFVVNGNEAALDTLFKKESRDVTVRDSANLRSDAYWAKLRKGSSFVSEKEIYTMIDTLGKMKIIKNYLNLLQTIFMGYCDFGPVSIGNIYSFIGYNSVEGWRAQYGMRTSREFSKDFRFGGYVGYTTRGNEARYGAELTWFVNKDPREYIGATYRNDVVPRATYDSYYTSPSDYFTTEGLRRIEAGHFLPAKVVQIRELRLNYSKQFKFGYSFTAGFTSRYLRPLGDFNFSYLAGSDALHPNTTLSAVTATEFNLTQRFAWQENFLTSDFNRYSLGTKFPVVTLQYAIGIRQFMDGGFNYHRLTGSLTDTRLVGPAGKLHWSIDAGKIFGNLPFLFLFMPDATETYISAFNYFNTIQRYQYVADRYVQVMFDHHLDGALFDRIPGLKKLKLREVWGLKMWWGDLSKNNHTGNYADLASNPTNVGLIQLHVADKVPLIEMSAGIENILHFIRLDVVWRVTQLDPRGNRFSVRYGNFGPRASFEWQF